MKHKFLNFSDLNMAYTKREIAKLVDQSEDNEVIINGIEFSRFNNKTYLATWNDGKVIYHVSFKI